MVHSSGIREMQRSALRILVAHRIIATHELPAGPIRLLPRIIAGLVKPKQVIGVRVCTSRAGEIYDSDERLVEGGLATTPVHTAAHGLFDLFSEMNFRERFL